MIDRRHQQPTGHREGGAACVGQHKAEAPTTARTGDDASSPTINTDKDGGGAAPTLRRHIMTQEQLAQIEQCAILLRSMIGVLRQLGYPEAAIREAVRRSVEGYK